jgi:hypothetical protein
MVDDIGCAAESPGWLPVPDGKELIRTADHLDARVHVGLFGRFHVRKLMPFSSVGQQRVVGGYGLGGQPISVLGSRDDDLEAAACINDGLGENLVGTVGKAGQTNKPNAGGQSGQFGPDRLIDEPSGRGYETAMPGYRNARHRSPCHAVSIFFILVVTNSKRAHAPFEYIRFANRLE